MQVFRFILLLFCFGLLSPLFAGSETEVQESKTFLQQNKDETKGRHELSVNDPFHQEAILDLEHQLNLSVVKAQRQNQLFSDPVKMTELVVQSQNIPVSSGTFSGSVIRLHLFFCVMRC